ncbi:hypothetical protein BDF14DRAFT_1955281 [Spinellus fusiger]|nr:hypothetical protein BDF14DRAFT_1955281 [Spinellus fusiger]
MNSTSSFRSLFNKPFLQPTRTVSVVQVGIDQDQPKALECGKQGETKDQETKKAATLLAEPLIYYNGRCESLDQLSSEKLKWIRDASPAEGVGVPHPSVNSVNPIVFRKPHNRSGYLPAEDGKQSKAMFYLRVLQVISKNHIKGSHFRCSVQAGQDVFMGERGTSEKSGKNTILTELEETFLCDFDQPSKIVLKVYSHSHSILHTLTGNTSETCVGQHIFQVNLNPLDKKLRRYTLEDSDSSSGASYQVLVIFGTYVSKDAQMMINNSCIYAGYITLYVRGQRAARWHRYWAVLLGPHLNLYDFEAKETREVLHTISLASLVDVFHPPDDNEVQVDVGSNGLILQFSPAAVDYANTPMGSSTTCLERRVYLLPDSVEIAQEWENAFHYVGLLQSQFREHEKSNPSITPRFLW